MPAANIAAVRLTLDGKDMADKVNPRLVELTLTEKRGGEADELSFTLHNVDGRLAFPQPGKVIALALGWKQGADVTPGLIDKGRFKVDEVEAGGYPDTVRITARSADLGGKYRKRRTHVWKDTTLGAVLGEIAARNDVTARIHPDLAARPIAALDQHGKSDMALVRDLGHRYDAVATWKDRNLLFMPIGADTSVSGKPLPALTLTRRDGWTWRFTRAQRDENDGAEAEWHDQKSGRRHKHSTGGQNPRKLKRVYASEADAKQAAHAAASKGKRGGYAFEYDLAFADCTLQPNRKLTLSGWGTVVDGKTWLIESIETNWTSGGMRQKLKAESA